MEADQVDFFSAAVPGDFEQVEDAEETGCAGQLGRDVGEPDGLNGIDFDLAFFHAVTSAHFHAGILPYTNARGDIAPTNAIAKAPGEQHGREFTRAQARF